MCAKSTGTERLVPLEQELQALTGSGLQQKVPRTNPAIKDGQASLNAQILRRHEYPLLFVNKGKCPMQPKGLSTLKLKGRSARFKKRDAEYQHITTPPSGITRRSNSPSRNATVFFGSSHGYGATMNSSYEQKHPLYAASFTKRRKAMDLYEGGERIEGKQGLSDAPHLRIGTSNTTSGRAGHVPQLRGPHRGRVRQLHQRGAAGAYFARRLRPIEADADRYGMTADASSRT